MAYDPKMRIKASNLIVFLTYLTIKNIKSLYGRLNAFYEGFTVAVQRNLCGATANPTAKAGNTRKSGNARPMRTSQSISQRLYSTRARMAFKRI